VSAKDNWVLAMDVARDDQELFVITDAGFGKRTGVDQFRKTKRGAMGVRAIKAASHKGDLAGALVVREHEELLFISEGGLVQRTSVRGISRQGRDATGVRVMNVREDDRVSAVALVVESDEDEAIEASIVLDEPVSLGASGSADEPALQQDTDEISGGGITEPAAEDGDMPDTDLEE
jgi:DNA gyrase subunit A